MGAGKVSHEAEANSRAHETLRVPYRHYLLPET